MNSSSDNNSNETDNVLPPAEQTQPAVGSTADNAGDVAPANADASTASAGNAVEENAVSDGSGAQAGSATDMATESADNKASDNKASDNEVGQTPEEGLADESLLDDDLDGDYEEEEFEGDANPIEEVDDQPQEEVEKLWYILKVQVNREKSICEALERRVKMHGLENQFGDILVPTEDIKEFTKSGKQRIVKRKLYPGYIVVNMAINDDTWFIVRETPGIGDFTGSAGKPAPLDSAEVEKILRLSRPPEVDENEGAPVLKNSFPYKVGDQVRVNEGNFQSLEGEVENIDESNGRITVMLNMFGRATPVQLDHWQVEKV